MQFLVVAQHIFLHLGKNAQRGTVGIGSGMDDLPSLFIGLLSSTTVTGLLLASQLGSKYEDHLSWSNSCKIPTPAGNSEANP